MRVPWKAYVVCGNPRSGTTLLIGLLRQSGVAGQPDAFFREKSRADWAADWGLSAPPDAPDVAYERDFIAAADRAGRRRCRV